MVGSGGNGERNEYSKSFCLLGLWGWGVGGRNKAEMKYLMGKGILMENKAVFCYQ